MNTCTFACPPMTAPEPPEHPESGKRARVFFILAYRCAVGGCGRPVTVTDSLDYECSAGHLSSWAERADRMPRAAGGGR